MHIELYQWIAFFAGAQMVRVALESSCGSTGLGSMDVASGKNSYLSVQLDGPNALPGLHAQFTIGGSILCIVVHDQEALSFADSLTTLIATVIARDQRVAICANLYLDAPPCPGCDTHQFCAEIITASIMWQSLGVVFNLVINLFLSLGIHQHCIQMKKVGKINTEEKPTVDFKVDLDAEGFQVVELK
ncbi:hypothetical protein INT44_003621 [Umbelopsis vinacea]|uniref:Uncharacterized protein n=1 Tax=Umbelopsis vinacea TaxID=44442 RepID=A0A8H7PUN0_9FUNG|nr:hypothetical protein INT44_003621 [Umbelopsis vinacea]